MWDFGSVKPEKPSKEGSSGTPTNDWSFQQGRTVKGSQVFGGKRSKLNLPGFKIATAYLQKKDQPPGARDNELYPIRFLLSEVKEIGMRAFIPFALPEGTDVWICSVANPKERFIARVGALQRIPVNPSIISKHRYEFRAELLFIQRISEGKEVLLDIRTTFVGKIVDLRQFDSPLLRAA